MKSQRAANAASCTSSSEASGRAVTDVFHDRAMKQRDVLRHDADRVPQALLRHAGDVLSVDQDAAVLHVIEALQQREQRRLAAARAADQADAFAGHEA